MTELQSSFISSSFIYFANNSRDEGGEGSEGNQDCEAAKEARPRKLDIFQIFQICCSLIATKKAMRRERATRKRIKLKKSDQPDLIFVKKEIKIAKRKHQPLKKARLDICPQKLVNTSVK